MSMFIGNLGQYGVMEVDQRKIQLAQIQFEAQASTFNKILSSCQTKCIKHEYAEGDLHTGEQSCIDRCVSKYVKANLLVGEEFTKNGLNPYNIMPDYEKVKTMIKQGGSE
ncbi:subunit of the TIM22-complex [Scheffersomyces coipomensis]|uniref:subunit of the TIM22-complex n=1 Tax=Scheffersomyces coipomensis TaxID=1788519 RepID=UPI00315D3E10